MSRFRLVALDLDGTLLDDAGRIGARTAARVAEARRLGVAFTLVTGRPFAAVRRYARQLGISLPLVCHHGALVREPDTGRVRFHRPIEPALAAGVAAFLAAAGAEAVAHEADRLFAPRLDRAAAAFYRAHGVAARAVGDLAAHLRARGGPGPAMLSVRGDAGWVAALAAAVEGAWAGRVDPQRPGPGALDLVAAGVAKEAAVARLASDLGVPREAVLAVGNGENDLGLLGWAGLGVAVANASPALLATAGWVAPDNNHDAVAAVLDRFIFGEPEAR